MLFLLGDDVERRRTGSTEEWPVKRFQGHGVRVHKRSFYDTKLDDKYIIKKIQHILNSFATIIIAPQM